jgi:hypothetical protein
MRREVSMEFRVMDEAVVFGDRGLALLVNESSNISFIDGCRIRDIRGRVHIVEFVTEQEGLICLFVRGGDEEYFGRLFRDVLVDASLFTLLEGDA